MDDRIRVIQEIFEKESGINEKNLNYYWNYVSWLEQKIIDYDVIDKIKKRD